MRQRLKGGASQRARQAGRLGEEAVALGLDALDLARTHEKSVNALTPPQSTAKQLGVIRRRASQFFFEALRPVAATNRDLKAEIVHRKQAEEALRKSERHHVELLQRSRAMEERQRRLSHRVMSVQEEERKKISRELHEQISQMLAGINVHLATLKGGAALNTLGLNGKIRSSQLIVERSVKTLHRFAEALRPPVLDDLGLIPALHSELKQFTQRTGVVARLTAPAGVEELHIAKRAVLFRIAQAALTNVGQHARATKVILTLTKRDETVHMQLQDDGRSFDVEQVLSGGKNRRLGLLGMRERAEMVGGIFSIHSAPGLGTTIGTVIPWGNNRRKTLP